MSRMTWSATQNTCKPYTAACQVTANRPLLRTISIPIRLRKGRPSIKPHETQESRLTAHTAIILLSGYFSALLNSSAVAQTLASRSAVPGGGFDVGTH